MDFSGGDTENFKRETAAVTAAVTDSQKNDTEKPLIKKSIGVCGLESCHESFVKTVPNKKYCCEEHKVLAWELRTGRTWHGKKTALVGKSN